MMGLHIMETKDKGEPGSQEDQNSLNDIQAKIDAGLNANAAPDSEEEEEAAAEGAEEEAGEEEPEAESEESEESEEDDGDDEDAEGEDLIRDGEIEGLSERSQAKINKRIHKVNVRRKNAEQEAAQLKQRVETLEAGSSQEFAREAVRLGFAPDYLNEAEVKLLQRDDELRAAEDFLFENLDGWEDGEGKEYDGKTMRRRYREVRAEREGVQARAAAIRMERGKQMRDDLAAGRRLREEGAKAPESGKPRPKASVADPAKQPARKKAPIPPALPQGGASPSRAPKSTGSQTRRGFDAKTLVTEGVTQDSLQRALANAMP